MESTDFLNGDINSGRLYNYWVGIIKSGCRPF